MTDCVKASWQLLLDADAADEGFAFGIGPGAKSLQFVVFDQELSAAARTDDRLLAISSRLAPRDDIAERMAIAGAEVIDDRADVCVYGLLTPYPGSDLSIFRLPNDESITRRAGAVLIIDIVCSSILTLTAIRVNPSVCLMPRAMRTLLMSDSCLCRKRHFNFD